MDRSPRLVPLLTFAALVTLAVTVLRVLGERAGWPSVLAAREDGAASIVGIVWLVPLFGGWFGYRLARAGTLPKSLGRAIALGGLGVALYVGLMVLVTQGFGFDTSTRDGLVRQLLAMGAASVLASIVAFAAWPALFVVNLAYGLLARVPVAVVTWYAVTGKWGTHYEKFGRNDYASFDATEQASWLIYVQLVFWVAFTIVFGALFGVLAAIPARRRATTV